MKTLFICNNCGDEANSEHCQGCGSTDTTELDTEEVTLEQLDDFYSEEDLASFEEEN